MIDSNNSSQDYFLMFKNYLIASILVPYGQESFKHARWFSFFFSFKKNQSRGKCNLVLYVMRWQTVSKRGEVRLKGMNFLWSVLYSNYLNLSVITIAG